MEDDTVITCLGIRAFVPPLKSTTMLDVRSSVYTFFPYAILYFLSSHFGIGKRDKGRGRKSYYIVVYSTVSLTRGTLSINSILATVMFADF